MIPDEFKFLENGENLLLFDSGERNGDRILVFGTESGLDDSVKYKYWTCDGRRYGLYHFRNLHILIDNKYIPGI